MVSSVRSETLALPLEEETLLESEITKAKRQTTSDLYRKELEGERIKTKMVSKFNSNPPKGHCHPPLFPLIRHPIFVGYS
jgi:hypothetical protein